MIERELGNWKDLIGKLKKATHWHVAFFIAYSGRGFSGKRRRTSTKNSGTK